MRITFDLPATPAAARAARTSLEQLRGEVDRASIDTLKLLVTELVTNCLRHCNAPHPDWQIHVNIEARPGSVYAEVCDPGTGFDVDLERPAPFEVAGRGLFLVDQLAERWGLLGENTSCVWFELPTADVRERVGHRY